MLPRKVAVVRFEVVTPYGVAYRGTSARDLGSWNSGYQAVYQLSFSGLRLPGQYQVRLLSPAGALGTVAGMRSCSAGHFGPYDTKTAAYQDNVASWPSVEPADDYTANSLLAFALGAQQGMTGSGLG